MLLKINYLNKEDIIKYADILPNNTVHVLLYNTYYYERFINNNLMGIKFKKSKL